MGYLGAGIVFLAVLGGPGGASGACQAPPLVTTVAPASSPVASPTSTSSPSPSTSPSPPPPPVSLSSGPVLTGHPSGTWTTTIYLNTAALCPSPPSFELVTTSPNATVLGQAKLDPPLECGKPAYALTQVQLTFGPCTSLATSPATAAVVVTPAQPGAGPVQIAVAVHRWVSWCLYLWWPALAGLVLAAAFIFTMLAAGLPDPNQVRADGRTVTVRWARVWSRPLYAAGAWTFSGSWATNVTAAAAIATAVLTATGALTEIFPGVELGRFSLLIAVAGAITVMAPLVFGALNYRFLRVDPSTAGVSVISLPRGPVAVLRGRIRSVLLGCWKPAYRYAGMVVTLPEGMRVRLRNGTELQLPPTTRLPPYSRVTVLGTQVPPLPYGAPATTQVTLPDGTPVRLGDRKALLPDQGEWRKAMTLAVPASATITVTGGATIPAHAPATPPPAPVPQTPQPQAWWRRWLRCQSPAVRLSQTTRVADVPDPALFTKLPAAADATLKAGATLSIPPGGTIIVIPDKGAAAPLLALPGTTDVAVFASGVPRGFRTVHPLGWMSGKVK